MPSIDAEVVAVRAGVLRLLTGRGPRGAHVTPDRIRALASSFALAKAPHGRPVVPRVEWQLVRDAAMAAPTTDAIERACDGIVDVRDIPDVIAVAARCQAHLAETVRLVARETPFGPRAVDPGASEVLRYQRIAGALIDPMTVMRDLVACAVSREQSRAVEVCFPALWDTMKMAVWGALSGRGVDPAAWQTRALEPWLRAPALPSALLRAFQDTARHGTDAERAEEVERADLRVPDLTTPTQRLEDR